jgi:phosphate transport system permease protein
VKGQEALILSVTLAATALVFAPFFWILGAVAYNGALVLAKAGLGFLLKRPPLPGTNSLGGIGTVIEGSLLIVGMAMAIATPLSLLTALHITLHEDSPIAKLGRALMDIMVEFPTIVIGISVFLIFGLALGLGLSALTASIALAVIMIPYTTIQAVEAMKIPKEVVYEAAVALGLREGHVAKIILTEGKGGVITGVLIGMAKIFGETAPLLFTTATSFDILANSPLSPVSAVPVLIFVYAFSPYTNWQEVAWGASLVLSLIVLGIYIAVRLSLSKGGLRE